MLLQTVVNAAFVVVGLAGVGMYVTFVKEKTIGWPPSPKLLPGKGATGETGKDVDISYDISDFSAPKLIGLKLRIFVLLNNTPVIGEIIRMHLLAKQNFIIVRRYARHLHMVNPTYHPVPDTEELGKLVDDAASKREFGLGWLAEQLQEQPIRTGWRHYTSSDLTAAYRRGQTTPVEVVKATIALVRDSLGPGAVLVSFSELLEDDARAQARESARRWASNKPLGPLDGVPVAVKNALDVRGYHNTEGTKFLGEHKGPSESDSAAVHRLRSAGAIIVGMTCMHEIGMGVTGQSIHEGRGPHRNPHNLSNYAGGSSSGSASAVAAGIVPIAVGVDGGGSIRIPAGLCGVWGIKPSYGRVPDRMCHSVSQTGPITSSMRDLAIAYLVMSGKTPDDLGGEAGLFGLDHAPLPVPHVEGYTVSQTLGGSPLRGVKIGVYRRYFEHCSEEVRDACWKKVKEMEGLGASVVDIEIENLEEMRLAHIIIISSEANIEHDQFYSSDPGLFQPDNQIVLGCTRQLRCVDLLAALKVRTAAMRQMADIFSKIDLMAMPTCGIAAPPVGTGDQTWGESDIVAGGRIARYSFLANLCGFPAISVPAGSGADSLPIGFQLMATHSREDTLFRAASVIEAAGFAQTTRPSTYLGDGITKLFSR